MSLRGSWNVLRAKTSIIWKEAENIRSHFPFLIIYGSRIQTYKLFSLAVHHLGLTANVASEEKSLVSGSWPGYVKMTGILNSLD